MVSVVANAYFGLGLEIPACARVIIGCLGGAATGDAALDDVVVGEEVCGAATEPVEPGGVDGPASAVTAGARPSRADRARVG